ncbi:hypothetical protein BKA70DRAFT_1215823 [Coprinopsis sp. MPI-PUGE-AT-0042]|nr:hypothetical protein BKA70DRAFT_1215823 [Coprinopsis sp. MPI-PUGE-AT-0042]
MSTQTSKDRYYQTSSIGKYRRGSPSELQSNPFSLQTGQGTRKIVLENSKVLPSNTGTFRNAYTAPRSSPGRGYDINPQAFYPSQWHSGNSPPLAPAFPSYDTTSGHLHGRQSPQPNYTTYSTRTSSPSVLNQAEPPRLPPPLSSSPGGDRWQRSGNYGMPTAHRYDGGQTTSLRSPSANYRSHMSYHSSSQDGAYTYLPMYEQLPLGQRGQSSALEDLDLVHIQHHRPQQRPSSPYTPRGGSSQTHPFPPISPTTAEELSIKKKRKRADAHQLKALNETYARTASPSTEEQHALAKALDMSPRSVQTWFQTQRQSMRQTTHQSSTVSSSDHQQQQLFSLQWSQGGEMSHGYPAGSFTLTELPYMGGSTVQKTGRGHSSLSISSSKTQKSIHPSRLFPNAYKSPPLSTHRGYDMNPQDFYPPSLYTGQVHHHPSDSPTSPPLQTRQSLLPSPAVQPDQIDQRTLAFTDGAAPINLVSKFAGVGLAAAGLGLTILYILGL